MKRITLFISKMIGSRAELTDEEWESLIYRFTGMQYLLEVRKEGKKIFYQLKALETNPQFAAWYTGKLNEYNGFISRTHTVLHLLNHFTQWRRDYAT